MEDQLAREPEATTDDPDLVAKLVAAKTRAASPQNRVDVSKLTSQQFIAMLRRGASG